MPCINPTIYDNLYTCMDTLGWSCCGWIVLDDEQLDRKLQKHVSQLQLWNKSCIKMVVPHWRIPMEFSLHWTASHSTHFVEGTTVFWPGKSTVQNHPCCLEFRSTPRMAMWKKVNCCWMDWWMVFWLTFGDTLSIPIPSIPCKPGSKKKQTTSVNHSLTLLMGITWYYIMKIGG